MSTTDSWKKKRFKGFLFGLAFYELKKFKPSIVKEANKERLLTVLKRMSAFTPKNVTKYRFSVVLHFLSDEVSKCIGKTGQPHKSSQAIPMWMVWSLPVTLTTSGAWPKDTRSLAGDRLSQRESRIEMGKSINSFLTRLFMWQFADDN